jgi:pyroglutamyl-peptidase
MRPKDARPIRVLITGYGPFQHITNNPSGAIAERLGLLDLPGVEIRAHVLDVAWDDVDAFIEGELQDFEPDIVISMGFKDGAHEVKQFAVNEKSGTDNDGVSGGGDAIETEEKDGVDQFQRTTLPLDRIMHDQEALGEEGLVLVDHTEPNDRFLCNYIEYRTLDALEGTDVLAGFVHLSDAERDYHGVKQLLLSSVAEVQDRRDAEARALKVA